MYEIAVDSLARKFYILIISDCLNEFILLEDPHK